MTEVVVAEPVRVAVVIDARAGRVMRSIAVAGVVVSAVLTIVAWRFLGDLERNVDQSLRIGEDAAETLSETIDVAAGVLAAVDAGAETLDRSLDAVGSGVGDAASVASATSALSTSIVTDFDDVDAALAQIEGLTGTVDATLRALSDLPLAPDYDPEVSFPQAVADIRGALGPIGDDLRTLADRLDEFAANGAGLTAGIDALQADLAEAREALADSDRLLDRYRIAAEEAGALAADSRGEFETSMWWARVALLLVAAWIVVAQYVPWWLARQARLVTAAPATSPDSDGVT